jgi:protein ImuB
MLWAALRLPRPELAAVVAAWALRYTPRVARVDEALLLELGASQRLFGGAAALRARLAREAAEQGLQAPGWGRSALAALGRARAGRACALDALPLHALSAARPHLDTFEQLGCHSWGELRRLPRDALARRFGPGLLDALAAAYGERVESFVWWRPPDAFDVELELPARVAEAAALLHAAQRLLRQLGDWLRARQGAVDALTLHGGDDVLELRCARPTRDVDHLQRLLAERLARFRLRAPVERLRLCAQPAVDAAAPATSLWRDAAQQRAELERALERVAARLGAQRVVCAQLRADHRPEAVQRWLPATAAPGAPPPPPPRLPQPAFLLDVPLRLAQRGEVPLYEGEVELLLGPQRIEAGWWDRDGDATRHVARDYWVARSARAGLLWLFQSRGADAAWFLHGIFA